MLKFLPSIVEIMKRINVDDNQALSPTEKSRGNVRICLIRQLSALFGQGLGCQGAEFKSVTTGSNSQGYVWPLLLRGCIATY